MATVIRTCSCKNAYQDETHGKGQRVMNEGIKSYCCTVCGTKHPKPVKG